MKHLQHENMLQHCSKIEFLKNSFLFAGCMRKHLLKESRTFHLEVIEDNHLFLCKNVQRRVPQFISQSLITLS